MNIVVGIDRQGRENLCSCFATAEHNPVRHFGVVRAFCRLSPARDPEHESLAEVTHLYVAPESTARGTGHLLFSQAIAHAKDQSYRGLLLWVLEENSSARRFYERHGLRPDGARHEEPEWLGPGVFEVRYAMGFERATPEAVLVR